MESQPEIKSCLRHSNLASWTDFVNQERRLVVFVRWAVRRRSGPDQEQRLDVFVRWSVPRRSLQNSWLGLATSCRIRARERAPKETAKTEGDDRA